MILLIDNYDSFTYNLYQYLGELDEAIMVKRNDEVTLEDIANLKPEAIVISPGPGRPEQAGVCVDAIKTFYERIPILGICLGHQAMGYSFGATVEKVENIMHGKVSKLQHAEEYLFQSLPQEIDVMRYHSLVINKDTVPACFQVLAKSMDDDEIMAIKHNQYPLYGMQFHPESVGTKYGKQLLQNFLTEIRKEVSL
ncbi:aminodeoxychorismate/anthranilate synthase component II [Bacillus sp. V3B]|uniref:anthranilate synthase component II n=1 Tax=Bacillus sp. V3B TaxID=2804915 RepID=UPI00210EC403|nr:aminodeoxychorismate/anthranilate synthase component II [Bacillus sp. V3B]MCQ6274221.1 aminodeoxychorismate/anthranilate synthase component II [Bacillus sp. V3B]